VEDETSICLWLFRPFLDLGRGNWSTRRKSAPVPLCPPQTPRAVWTRTRGAAVGSQRLSTWATARPATPLGVYRASGNSGLPTVPRCSLKNIETETSLEEMRLELNSVWYHWSITMILPCKKCVKLFVKQIFPVSYYFFPFRTKYANFFGTPFSNNLIYACLYGCMCTSVAPGRLDEWFYSYSVFMSLSVILAWMWGCSRELQKQNVNFLENGRSGFDQISVIYSDHIPK
jgi:hypothetical protein